MRVEMEKISRIFVIVFMVFIDAASVLFGLLIVRYFAIPYVFSDLTLLIAFSCGLAFYVLVTSRGIRDTIQRIRDLQTHNDLKSGWPAILPPSFLKTSTEKEMRNRDR